MTSRVFRSLATGCIFGTWSYVLLGSLCILVKGDTVFSNITGPGSVTRAGTAVVCSESTGIGCDGVGTIMMAAAAFTPTANYMMTDVQVFVASAGLPLPGRNVFDVFLYSDSGGVPGSSIAQIGSRLAAPTLFPGSIVTASSIGTAITLISGTRYWLVLAPLFGGSFIYWADGGSPAVPTATRKLSFGSPPEWMPRTGSLQFQIDGVPAARYVEIVPPRFETSVPTGINNAGSVTGLFEESDWSHGFVRDAGGTTTVFDACDSSIIPQTYPSGINNAGTITGHCTYNLAYRQHGFVRDPQGNITLFDAPGDNDPWPQSVNAGGAITGYYYTNYPLARGFVRYADGTVISFDPAGSISTIALGINSNGDITGHYNESNLVVHGFVRHADGTFVSFDPPGSTGTFPASINYAGTITGSYTKADGRTYGFVRDTAGTITSFDPGTDTFPTGINSKGVITGYYTNNNNFTDITANSGFVRSPDGTTTLLDPPHFCPGYVRPASINEGGVITGSCGSPYSSVGWVRYP